MNGMGFAQKKALDVQKGTVIDPKREYQTKRPEKKLTDHQGKQYFIRFFAGFMALWVILSLTSGVR